MNGFDLDCLSWGFVVALLVFFYRYFENKNSKEEMLLFKIKYEWEQYPDKRENDKQGKEADLTAFIYDKRRLFSMLYHNHLISVIMRAPEDLIPSGETYDKGNILWRLRLGVTSLAKLEGHSAERALPGNGRVYLRQVYPERDIWK